MSNLCDCGKKLAGGSSKFSEYLRSIGTCHTCYKKRPKTIKKCRHNDCDSHIAGGYGKVAVAARGEGFCRKHFLEWAGPQDTHVEARTLAAIAKEVDAGFVQMDQMLEKFGETVQDLDASAEILERLVNQVSMRKAAVSELEDTLNQQVTVVSRRLKKLARKVLDL